MANDPTTTAQPSVDRAMAMAMKAPLWRDASDTDRQLLIEAAKIWTRDVVDDQGTALHA